MVSLATSAWSPRLQRVSRREIASRRSRPPRRSQRQREHDRDSPPRIDRRRRGGGAQDAGRDSPRSSGWSPRSARRWRFCATAPWTWCSSRPAFPDGENGLDVIRGLSGERRRPIFVIATGLDREALSGFALGVVDYLLKPVPVRGSSGPSSAWRPWSPLRGWTASERSGGVVSRRCGDRGVWVGHSPRAYRAAPRLRLAELFAEPLRALLGLARHVELRRVEQRPDLDLRLLAVMHAEAERRALGPLDRLGERLDFEQ